MSLSPRRNDDDATTRHLTGHTQHEGPLSGIRQPPFIADAVKRSVLYHIGSYQMLSDQIRLRTKDTSESITVTQLSDSLDVEDPVTRRRLVQRKLMNELQRLLDGIARLERLLRRGRLMRWLVNGTLACLWHAVVLNMLAPTFSHRFPKMHAWLVQIYPHMHVKVRVSTTYLATMAYLVSLPLFAFPLLNYEKQLSCTLVVRDLLVDLYGLVRDGDRLGERDVKVLRDSRWDAVPWDQVEG
ncbi:hypothetical protein G647_03898 [Cladophialophora carrionii CBS 160.54]|uniref:Uncharacterized protein n=1 Tax=Cladophialophora carrionii CBS 160.54 TaxID=1279043 RepID=V9DCA3_9EURO|nr:uncharacterized protein G647_03898 [Cladophialophora carrionii CBS 160.54]ETI24529.1 hypothetical protein G647_03898 [Cladophialophora carrionii CBS 160.54]